jgi:hypothetical protein
MSAAIINCHAVWLHVIGDMQGVVDVDVITTMLLLSLALQ